MATKELILGRIRDALSDLGTTRAELPEVPSVWPIQGLTRQEMATRFETNLREIKGEVHICESLDDVVRNIKTLLKGTDTKSLAVLDRPLTRSVAEKLTDKQLLFPPENPDAASPETLAQVDAALVTPEYLIVDTGSCIFRAPTAFDRLTTYITPISFVVAATSMLRENLPAVWDELKPQLCNMNEGEFVIVTGPSRTADIEKILILGVHGPKRLIVYLYDDEKNGSSL